MKSLTPLLVLLSLVPLMANLLAVLFLLPDTIPLHAGFFGIDSYGSKFSTFWVGGILTAVNLVGTICFHNAEKLYARGAVHGTNVKGARIVLTITVIVLDLLFFATLFFFWL